MDSIQARTYQASASSGLISTALSKASLASAVTVRSEKLLALVVPEVAEMQPHPSRLFLRVLLVHFSSLKGKDSPLTDPPSVTSRTSVPTASAFVGIRKHTESPLSV